MTLENMTLIALGILGIIGFFVERYLDTHTYLKYKEGRR